MDNAERIAEIVLPVLVSLLLGWVSRLRGILSRAQIDGLKTFVVTFSLPAVLFMAFAEIAYGLDVLLTCLAVFAACTAMLFIGKLFRRENPLLPFQMCIRDRSRRQQSRWRNNRPPAVLQG